MSATINIVNMDVGAANSASLSPEIRQDWPPAFHLRSLYVLESMAQPMRTAFCNPRQNKLTWKTSEKL
jgi:hypothetical protein